MMVYYTNNNIVNNSLVDIHHTDLAVPCFIMSMVVETLIIHFRFT